MIKAGKYTINVPVMSILKKIRETTSNRGDVYLKNIVDSEPAIMITCPIHKHHNENKPSCGVFVKSYKGFNEGDFHCFACGCHGSIVDLVGICLNLEDKLAIEWLHEHFGGIGEDVIELPEISLNKTAVQQKVVPESKLKEYDFYHPYMYKRNLKKEVIDAFRVGYDSKKKALTFPVWNEHDKVVFVTERAVDSKNFYIPKEVDKPLYLMNFVKKFKVPMVMITEAQIDALTAWGYGFPCCATMGVPSYKQIESLNKSGILIVVSAFDNDEYGRKFTDILKNRIKDSVLLYELEFPNGKKDINDLTEKEFNDCLTNIGINYRFYF